jgi:hypothetical protein
MFTNHNLKKDLFKQKGCTRLAAASDKVYQLLTHGRWFFPGTPASSTTKTGRHDIAEILLKVALKHQKSNHDSEVETTDMYWSVMIHYYITDCGAFKIHANYPFSLCA